MNDVTDAQVSEQNDEHQSSTLLGDSKSTQWEVKKKSDGKGRKQQ